MALCAQVLDHSGWFSNPLRFNVFAPVSVGVREGEQRMRGQVRSNVLTLYSLQVKAEVERRGQGQARPELEPRPEPSQRLEARRERLLNSDRPQASNLKQPEARSRIKL